MAPLEFNAAIIPRTARMIMGRVFLRGAPLPFRLGNARAIGVAAAPSPSAALFLLFQIELKDRRVLPDLFPHRFDSVAELSRPFEIELVGRLQHLLLEFVEVIERNNLLGVNSRRSADLLVRGRLSFDPLFNGPPNRFRRNSVFLVILLLPRASAFRFALSR